MNYDLLVIRKCSAVGSWVIFFVFISGSHSWC